MTPRKNSLKTSSPRAKFSPRAAISAISPRRLSFKRSARVAIAKPFSLTGQLNDWLQTEGLAELSPRLEERGITAIDEIASLSDDAATGLASDLGMNQASTEQFNDALHRLRESPPNSGRPGEDGPSLPRPHLVTPVRSTQLPKLSAKAKVLPSWFKSAVNGKKPPSQKYAAADLSGDDNF